MAGVPAHHRHEEPLVGRGRVLHQVCLSAAIRLGSPFQAVTTRAMLVGGGPAPGIIALIAAAPIEARHRGVRVLGCQDGSRWRMRGDVSRMEEPPIEGCPACTSRAVPSAAPHAPTPRAAPTPSGRSWRGSGGSTSPPS